MSTEYQEKCQEIAEKMGCDIIVEGSNVYLKSEEIKSHFLTITSSSKWKQIYAEFSKWGEGCNLIAPVKIS